MRIRLLACLLLLVPFQAASAGDELPPEVWTRLYVAGGYSGYVHVAFERATAEDGTKRVESNVDMHMDLTRFGQPTAIAMHSTTWESPAGKLLQIKTVSKVSAEPTTTVYTFQDGKVTIETTVLGNTRAVVQEVPEGLTGPAYQSLQIQKLVGTNGQSMTFQSFSSDLGKAASTTVTTKGVVDVIVRGGKTAKGTHMVTNIEGMPYHIDSWISADEKAVKTSFTTSGLLFEIYQVADEAAAKAKEGAGGKQPDVFEKTLVRESDPIPTPRSLERAVMTLKRTDGKEVPAVADAGHVVTPNDDGSVTIVASRIVPPADKQGARPVAVTEELKHALGASSMIQADAPEIVAKAQELVGDEPTIWKAAQTLERFVYEHMTQKDMSSAFASALESYRNKQGDCTEHAVLLAAMCRAVGIPTRVVMGPLFLYGIWGGHAWNEVWVDGTWYPLDATNGLGHVDPLHLPFARMTMHEGGESEMVMMLSGIGNVDIDITEVTRSGRVIAVQQSASLITHEGAAYKNRIWNVAFTSPEGFSATPPSKSMLSARIIGLEGKDTDGATVSIRLDGQSAPKGGTIDDLDRAMKLSDKGAKKTEVDGRPARTITVTRNEHEMIQTFVVEDGATFVFTVTHANHANTKKAYELFLASVDFDLK